MNTLAYFKNLRWKEINILDVLKGCSSAYLTDTESRGEEYNNVIKYRMKICSKCELFTGTVCDPTKEIENIRTGKLTKGCGCSIVCKTALKDSNCPAGKWLAIK